MNMKKINQTLNTEKFNRLLLMWTNVDTQTICVRDKMTGQTKIIKIVK